MVGVLPGFFYFEGGAGEEGFDGGGGELVAVLGVDGLAGGEVKGKFRATTVCGDVDALGDERFEVHLDAGFGGVPDDLVAEGGGVEVGAEVAVEAGEDVEVEGGGGACGVIVGGEEGGLALVAAGNEVGAEQKFVAGEELGAEVAEDLGCVAGGEVADAGADVEGEGAGIGETVEGQTLAGVVGDLNADNNARDVGADVLAGRRERGRGDVDGLVDDASLPADCGGEEDSGLGGGACAQFDQGQGLSVSSGLLDDFVSVRGEDAALGAGEVVLGQGRNLLEEVGTGFIVEEPGGEGSGARGEAATGFGGYGFDGACLRRFF